MKAFFIGFLAGAAAMKFAEDWTLSMIIAEMQYYLNMLQEYVMTGPLT